MEKKPRNGKGLHIEGLPGTIFTKTLRFVVENENLENLQGLIDDVWGQLAEIDNDRAMVLVGALLIENAVDTLLAAIIPEFNSFKINPRVSLWRRIKLAKALEIIPPQHFDVAEKILKIRNDFAHELEMDSFDKIPENKVESLRVLLDGYTEDESKGKSVKEVFKLLVTQSTLALWLFSKHVSLLNEFIRSDKLLDALRDFACS